MRASFWGRVAMPCASLGIALGAAVSIGGCRTPWIGPFAKDAAIGCNTELSQDQRSTPSLWIRFYTPKNKPVRYSVMHRTYGGAADYYQPPECTGEHCLGREGLTSGDHCVYIDVGQPDVPVGHVEFVVVVDEVKYAATSTGIRVEDEVEELGLRVYRRPRHERRWKRKTQ